MESTSYSAIGPGPIELTSSARLYGAAPSWLLAEIAEGPGQAPPEADCCLSLPGWLSRAVAGAAAGDAPIPEP